MTGTGEAVGGIRVPALTDWTQWEYVTTYLNCKIYRSDMYGDYVYGSPCITGYYWTQKAVKKRICTGQGGTWDGTSCTFEPEPGVRTTLTLSAPNSVGVEEKFNVSGILYQTESGVPIPSQSINLSYNGKSLGSATTGIDGDYLKQASIPTKGVHTLKAEFPGAAGYEASSKTTRTGVGVPLTKIPYIAILPIVTGLAIAHLPRR